MRLQSRFMKPCLLAGLLCLTVAPCLAAGTLAARKGRGHYLDVIRPDRRPPLVGEREDADSLFGAMGASARADGIADSRRDSLEALVRRFAPTLVLAKGDHVRVNGRTFQLVPVHPLLLADTLRIDRIGAAPYTMLSSVDFAFRTASVESLARLVDRSSDYLSDPENLEAAYFDFPGESPREWWRSYAELRTGRDSLAWSEPVVFAHPFLDGAGGLFIQYWYFYPFNDYIGNHEGDWEHVGVGVSPDHRSVAAVHYYFHGRSVILPQKRYLPELTDGTHPVVYAGGRGYVALDYPLRLLRHERNSGSHGCYPYPGEWEGAAGLGTTESVSAVDADSLRFIAHDRFRVVLTPEPGRIDFRRNPEVLRDWAWFLLPVRWGFPSAPSLGSELRFTDSGNQAPFGPVYNAGWNRTAPGLTYERYAMRRLSPVRSILEDLVQPWYYLYAFRTPRFVPDSRDGRSRQDLERLGLLPRSGSAERGLGTTAFGLSLASPRDELGSSLGNSTGFLLWRSLWVKARFGMFEFTGGYQKFPAVTSGGGHLFVYPFALNLVARAPGATVRPYATFGGGAYGWEARFPTSLPDTQGVTSGWELGGTAGLGVEYYLRPRLALDLSVRYHECSSPGPRAHLGGSRLRFYTLQVGHYVRF